jgi:hypothetical protein
MTIGVQAIQVSDDDGGRVTPITPAQVRLWVDKAIEIYAGASIRFLFDPATDFTTPKSTVLNNMGGGGDQKWKEKEQYGDEIAARYQTKITVFFRYGPDTSPTGGAFSGSSLNFVAAAGFNSTGVCGYQNIGLFAHELGHYLGLSHTFAREFKSREDAETFLKERGNNPNVFDGDRLSDTPPDPYINTFEMQCKPVPSVILNDIEFQVPRANIMSYYEVRTGLSPQQIARARQILATRIENGMGVPPNKR